MSEIKFGRKKKTEPERKLRREEEKIS